MKVRVKGDKILLSYGIEIIGVDCAFRELGLVSWISMLINIIKPEHLGVEGKAVLGGHFGPRLEAVHAQLHGNAEAVEEVAAEDEGVAWRVDGVDPAGGEQERAALLEDEALAAGHEVGQEGGRLVAGQDPALVGGQVGLGGRDEPEELFAWVCLLSEERVSEEGNC